MHVEYDRDRRFARPKSKSSGLVSEVSDFTGTVKLERLAADTNYYYRVWFSRREGDGRPAVSQKLVGSFKTAPEPSMRRPVSFVFGGDLGGQGYCRRADQGYAIFSKMKALAPEFFIANGDVIYADSDCPATGPDGWHNVPVDFPSIAAPTVNWTDPAQVREVYLKH